MMLAISLCPTRPRREGEVHEVAVYVGGVAVEGTVKEQAKKFVTRTQYFFQPIGIRRTNGHLYRRAEQVYRAVYGAIFTRFVSVSVRDDRAAHLGAYVAHLLGK